MNQLYIKLADDADEVPKTKTTFIKIIMFHLLEDKGCIACNIKFKYCGNIVFIDLDRSNNQSPEPLAGKWVGGEKERSSFRKFNISN